MIHLFVIADDFTGALDTGVQFASYGAATKVVVGTGLQALEADAQTQVLVVDAETRHLPAAQAYDTVYRLVRWAKEKKIGCIYKKTDSALRGNIGAELSAALAAGWRRQAPFRARLPESGPASPAAAYTTSAACPLPKVCLERTPLSR